MRNISIKLMVTNSMLMLIAILPLEAQNLDFAFNGLKTLVPDVKKAVISVYARDIKSNADASAGSGFLCLIDKSVVAITCYHVVKSITELNMGVFVGLNTKTGFRKFPCTILSLDSINDIAMILPIKDPKENVELETISIDDQSISPDSAIVEGTTILTAGFPFGFGLEYDKYNPVFTAGFIAQKRNSSVFLADLTINRGNSGGPVFDIPNRKFVGMVKGYFNNDVSLVGPQGISGFSVPTNSGLANIVSATIIRQVLAKTKIK